MARHSSLRASDADRDAVAERLRQAAVEGRLEPDELEQRLHAALRAKTYADLDGLLGDLPAKPVKWERPRRAVAPTAGFALVMVLRAVVALAILGAVLVAAAATFAWWAVGLIVFLAVRSGHGCRGHRRSTGWHRPPHVRRV
jgi:hypothetical protein